MKQSSYNPYATNKTERKEGFSHDTSPRTVREGVGDEVYEFLKNIELSDYYVLFQQADVTDMEVMGFLNDDDLREIGLPVGSRRKLLHYLHSSENNNNNDNNNNNNIINDNNKNNNNDNNTSNTIEIYEKNNNNDESIVQLDTNSELPSGKLEELLRPWGFCILGICWSPFLCLSNILHFTGHTVYYSFDNDERKLYLHKHLGVCCSCLGVVNEEVDYDDIIDLSVDKTDSVNLNVRGVESPYNLSPGDGNTEDAIEQAKRISQFTGIPLK